MKLLWCGLGLVALTLLAGCSSDNPTTATTTGSPTSSTVPATAEPVPESSTVPPLVTSGFLLGGEFARSSYEPLFLDLVECPAGIHTQTFGLGSTTFEVQGIRDEQCLFNHGTEIESPEWNGAMTHACAIDTQATVELIVTDDGINLETFEANCVEI